MSNFFNQPSNFDNFEEPPRVCPKTLLFPSLFVIVFVFEAAVSVRTLCRVTVTPKFDPHWKLHTGLASAP
jgi:hypothetical protein